MKNHSNWLGFDVKIVKKRGLRKDGRGLKQVSHEKPFKKLFLSISRLSKLQKFSRVASESWKLLDELATRVSRLVSREVSCEKFRDWQVSREVSHEKL